MSEMILFLFYPDISFWRTIQRNGVYMFTIFYSNYIQPTADFSPPGFHALQTTAAVLPLLAAKQRPTHAHDWMASDAEVACPDPLCGTRLRITRTGTRTFSHGAVSGVPLVSDGGGK